MHESIIQNQIEYNYFLDVHVRSVTTNVTATVVAQVRDLYEPSALISGLPTNCLKMVFGLQQGKATTVEISST